jgi:hypothetical protein
LGVRYCANITAVRSFELREAVLDGQEPVLAYVDSCVICVTISIPLFDRHTHTHTLTQLILFFLPIHIPCRFNFVANHSEYYLNANNDVVEGSFDDIYSYHYLVKLQFDPEGPSDLNPLGWRVQSLQQAGKFGPIW